MTISSISMHWARLASTCCRSLAVCCGWATGRNGAQLYLNAMHVHTMLIVTWRAAQAQRPADSSLTAEPARQQAYLETTSSLVAALHATGDFERSAAYSRQLQSGHFSGLPKSGAAAALKQAATLLLAEVGYLRQNPMLCLFTGCLTSMCNSAEAVHKLFSVCQLGSVRHVGSD